jgi:nucleotide-binding universal stress UspA family protein
MKVLLAYDGSSYSEMAITTLKALHLPEKTKVVVLSVLPEHTLLGGINFHLFMGEAPSKKRVREEQQQRIAEMLEAPIQSLSKSGLDAESLVRTGNTAETVLKAAKDTGASLIVMGAKGLTDPAAFRLGSTAQRVISHSSASVLLVRKEVDSINKVLLATDGSRYADRAAKFLFELPLPKRAQIIVVTALKSHAAAIVSMPTLDFEANRKLIEDLQKAEEDTGRRIVSATADKFRKKGYKTLIEVVRGNVAESILMAADKHKPEFIAVGARGLPASETFFIGSVAERVARYAKCSVLICR